MNGKPNLNPQTELLDLQQERQLTHYIDIAGAHPVRVFFVRSYDQATSFIGTLNRMLVYLGIAVVLMAAALVFAISRQITRPLNISPMAYA